MCKLTKNLPIQGGCWIIGIQGEDLTRGEGKWGGGLRLPLELCFGTSEIECFASWSYMVCTHS